MFYGVSNEMKALSGSIIVLAASILILGGSYIPHGDTRLFLQIIGLMVCAMGMWGWSVSLKEK
ncbi:MAG TPA: hypothetical protein DIW81_29355 [Planctomycetaceae bacterium]|nr:hypothetical protein [Rubinisphaera sp.]HCS55648.1 hypothetical protein [Planctomycetaceae bacterium]|tara:strand:- start:958 stop:1146 length:189 start_codon:yes stop_codon:yes gene_type:complete